MDFYSLIFWKIKKRNIKIRILKLVYILKKKRQKKYLANSNGNEGSKRAPNYK